MLCTPDGTIIAEGMCVIWMSRRQKHMHERTRERGEEWSVARLQGLEHRGNGEIKEEKIKVVRTGSFGEVPLAWSPAPAGPGSTELAIRLH